MTPVGKAELDASGCETPNCMHDHTTLYLHSGCHPGAGLEARYEKKIGALFFNCAECDREVGSVWVGEQPVALQ